VQELIDVGRGEPRARPVPVGRPRPLVVEGLDVRYGRVRAVAELSFAVRPGSVVGLLGPNGCGKTSALRAIVGIARAHAGSVAVAGVHQPSLAARAEVAYVPDDPTGFDELCAREYFALVGALYRAGPAYAASAQTFADVFGLASQLRVRLGALSHGQRRLVSIVAAVALDRELLVIDEATAALDAHAVHIFREVLRGVAARGVGILAATQDLAFAERVCDEVVLLASGIAVASGPTARLAPLEATFLSAVDARGVAERIRHGLDTLQR
jgi:ABC-2 type transport system ATP-binding protein